MKHPKSIKIFLATLTLCLSSSVFAVSPGLQSIGTSIGQSADNYSVMAINSTIPFVVSTWAMLSNNYSQTGTAPAAGLLAVSSTVLGNNGTTITNTSFGTLDIGFGPGSPGSLEGKGFSLSPTLITLHGNTFLVYELVQCFTNITDSMTSQQTPQPGTSIALFGNSNLGSNCVYAANPSAAAVAAAQGAGGSA